MTLVAFLERAHVYELAALLATGSFPQMSCNSVLLITAVGRLLAGERKPPPYPPPQDVSIIQCFVFFLFLPHFNDEINCFLENQSAAHS